MAKMAPHGPSELACVNIREDLQYKNVFYYCHLIIVIIIDLYFGQMSGSFMVFVGFC